MMKKKSTNEFIFQFNNDKTVQQLEIGKKNSNREKITTIF